ncbi:MAG: hypothetical protein JKX68_03050 [Flavobacteriales bacterium]|nr:hypothetical protein [Flavobacteriales bacterium]
MFYGNGLIIDKERNRYKKYVSVLFFKVGDWKPLPKISFVAFTKVKGFQTMHAPRTMGASVSLKVDLFCVYLCIDSKNKVLVKKTKHKLEALTLATGAAKYLRVSLNNYIKKD